MKIRVRKETIGNFKIIFTSELYDGEICDTIISVNGADIMTISGKDIEDVIKVFNRLDEYSI